MTVRYPPLTPRKKQIINNMFVVPLAFSRPTSVEGEKASRRRRRLIKWVGALAVVLAVNLIVRGKGAFEGRGWW